MSEIEASGRTPAWHERRATTQHHRWYRNLVELHGLTQAWIRELGGEPEGAGGRPRHLLQRGIAPSDEVNETLWMLERLTRAPDVAPPVSGSEPGDDSVTDLEALLDDTSPDDLLGRLERAVWAVQAWTLSSLIQSTPEPDRPALRNQLEQLSWKAGRDCARRRWSTMPANVRSDARGVLAALADAPPFGRPETTALLIERAIAAEARFELQVCPHRRTYGELALAGPLVDDLCRLHAHWIRGFVYELHPALRAEHRIGEGGRRCAQSWRL
jgi:hypothetical protein